MHPQYTTKDIERFWEKVNKLGPDDCWFWLGYTTSFGHGQISVNGGPKYTHRFSWEIHNGFIPDGMGICHSCDRPQCVNPDHLFIGTQKDNMADCAKKGRNRTPGYKGEAHPRSKITDEQVITIRNEYAAGGITAQALAIKFGISKSSVLFIIHNSHWSHVPGPIIPTTTIQKGENNPASKLTEEMVVAIRGEYATGSISSLRLATKYGVSKPTILRIIHRRTWAHV